MKIHCSSAEKVVKVFANLEEDLFFGSYLVVSKALEWLGVCLSIERVEYHSTT